jgi:hypothetical protein
MKYEFLSQHRDSKNKKTYRPIRGRKVLLPRYHLILLVSNDQHAYHPDHHQGFAVTGYPCRSTLRSRVYASLKPISSTETPGDIRRQASVGALSQWPLLLCQRLYTYSSQRELLLFETCVEIIPISRKRVNWSKYLRQVKFISPARMATANWFAAGGSGQCQREL